MFMSVLEANLKLVKELHPLLYEELLRNQHLKDAVVVKRSGKFDWIIGKDYRFREVVDIPQDVAKSLETSRFVANFGFGLGYNLEEALKLTKISHVTLVVEPKIEILWAALKTRDLRHILKWPRLFFVTSTGYQFEEDVKKSLMGLGISMSRKITPVIHPTAVRFFKDIYEDQVKRLKDVVIQGFIRLGNSAEDTLIGMKQMAENIEFMAQSPSLDQLAGKFKDVPAVIVSAGPSLDKNFYLLEKVFDKAIVIAVDTVLRKFVKEGFAPHFVTALERGQIIYEKHFKDVIPPKDTILVGQSVIVPDVFLHYSSPKIVTFKAGLPLDEWIAQTMGLKPVVSGGSVAHMAFGLAMLMGCNPIVFIGQDLAYGKSGETHSKATAWEKGSPGDKRLRKEAFEIPGWGGGKVLTNRTWYSFLKTFEDLFSRVPRNIKIINATEGGASIPKTIEMPFERAISEYIAGSKLKQLPLDVLKFPDKDESLKRLDRFFDVLKQNKKSFLSIGNLIDKMEELAERIYRLTLLRAERYKLGAKLGRMMDSIYHINSVFYFIIQSFVYSTGAELAEITDLQDKKQLEKWKKIHDSFFESARVCLEKTVEFIDLMLDRAYYIKDVLQDEEKAKLLNLSEISLTEERYVKMILDAIENDNKQEFRFLIMRVKWEEVLDPDFLGLVANYALKCKLYDQAKMLLEKALSLKKDDPKLWNDYGVSLVSYEVGREPDFDRARLAFERALKLDPDFKEAKENREKLEEYAERYYRSALELVPENPALILRLADVLAVRKKDEEALIYYEKGLSLAPNNFLAMVNYALVLERNGKVEDAYRWLQRAYNLTGGKQLFVLWNYVKFCIRNGMEEEGLNLLYEIAYDKQTHPVLEKMLSVVKGYAESNNKQNILDGIDRIKELMSTVVSDVELSEVSFEDELVLEEDSQLLAKD